MSLKVAVVVCVSHAYDVVLVMSDPEEVLLTYPDYNVTITWLGNQFRMDDPYMMNGDEYAWFMTINS
jgi:hypothetical protein